MSGEHEGASETQGPASVVRGPRNPVLLKRSGATWLCKIAHKGGLSSAPPRTNFLPERESHVVEASRAAEAMGEPLSASPEPAVRARAAAKFADEIVEQYEDMRDYSSEEAVYDREAFEAAMQEYDREQQRKADIVQRGVGCLVGGGFSAEA